MICKLCWADKDSVSTRQVNAVGRFMNVSTCNGCYYNLRKSLNYLNMTAIEQGVLPLDVALVDEDAVPEKTPLAPKSKRRSRQIPAGTKMAPGRPKEGELSPPGDPSGQGEMGKGSKQQ